MADIPIPVQGDSPEARRYNRIKRWLGITDFVIGFAFLAVLLITGWTGWLRDLAYRIGFQHYSFSLFVYLLLLLLINMLAGRTLVFRRTVPLPTSLKITESPGMMI